MPPEEREESRLLTRASAEVLRHAGLEVIGRMAYRHGANADKICELADARPELRALLDLVEPSHRRGPPVRAGPYG